MTQAMIDSMRNAAMRDDNVRRLNTATGDYYANANDILKLRATDAMRQRAMQQRFDQEQALATLRAQNFQKVRAADAQRMKDREDAITLRQLAVKGFPVNPELTVDQNLAAASKWAQDKHEAVINDTASRLDESEKIIGKQQEKIDGIISEESKRVQKTATTMANRLFNESLLTSGLDVKKYQAKVSALEAEAKKRGFERSLPDIIRQIEAQDKSLAGIGKLYQDSMDMAGEEAQKTIDPTLRTRIQAESDVLTGLRSRHDRLANSEIGIAADALRIKRKSEADLAKELEATGDVGGVIESPKPTKKDWNGKYPKAFNRIISDPSGAGAQPATATSPSPSQEMTAFGGRSILSPGNGRSVVDFLNNAADAIVPRYSKPAPPMPAPQPKVSDLAEYVANLAAAEMAARKIEPFDPRAINPSVPWSNVPEYLNRGSELVPVGVPNAPEGYPYADAIALAPSLAAFGRNVIPIE